MSEPAWRDLDLFAPTPEHALLAGTLREFVTREVEPQAAAHDRSEACNHALFRRAERMVATEESEICIGRASVDLKKHTLTVDRKSYVLTFYEVELLKLLHGRADEPVSRDEILERVWGVEANPTNRTVDNFIVKLRKKIEESPKNPRHILTVYGYGYKLVL